MRRKERKGRTQYLFVILSIGIACLVHLESTKLQPKSESQEKKPRTSSSTNKAQLLSSLRWTSNSTTALQDAKCRRVYEWSLMKHWEANDERAIDFSSLPQTRNLRVARTPTTVSPEDETSKNSKSGQGTHAEMAITFRNRETKLTVVDMQVFDGTQSYSFAAQNLWHRMIPLYHSWVGLQTAAFKYDLVSERVVFYFNCQKHGKHLEDLPSEWERFGEVSCNGTLLTEADVLVHPPSNGFLWDLAWDMDLTCHNSSMFKTFASLFVNKSSRVTPTEPTGCFISRKGRPNQRVENWNQTLTMMKEIFPRVQVLTLTQYHTTDETAQILLDCRVLFGVHGAGHTNTIFARPGVGVVEMIGNATPAYFRNINMLLGQYYESIQGDSAHGMSGIYTVNLTEAKGALLRANEHASLWIQSHGHWR